MKNLKWSFQEYPEGLSNRANIEGEFFIGSGKSEEGHGFLDSFERESTQNSLDEMLPNAECVRLHYSFSKKPVSIKVANQLLGGLESHMLQSGLDKLDGEPIVEDTFPEMHYIKIEDYGTRGLAGAVDIGFDPPDNEMRSSGFYYFWRNFGRSGKSGADLGNWGLGKTVFPSGSKINTFWGLTVREDGMEYLMGQSILKMHRNPVSGAWYDSVGIHGIKKDGVNVVLPSSDKGDIELFKTIFDIQRSSSETGLSVIVPYPQDYFNETDLLRSVLVHFFMPIVKGELEVQIDGISNSFIITKDTIDNMTRKVAWHGLLKSKKSCPPPLALAEWGIRQKDVFQMDLRNTGKSPTWKPELFSESPQFAEYLRDINEGRPVAFKVIIDLKKSSGEVVDTHFTVYLSKNSLQEFGLDYYIRNGMTISRINTIKNEKGWNAILSVEDKELSAFLAKTEGPAHVDWNKNDKAPDDYYKVWKNRLDLIKRSPRLLINCLSPKNTQKNTDLLKSVFNLILPKDPDSSGQGIQTNGTSSSNKSNTPGIPGDPVPFPTDIKQRINMMKLVSKTGFKVMPGKDWQYTDICTIKAAYKSPRGNSFKKYSKTDFIFNDVGTSLQISHDQVEVIKFEDNVLKLKFLDPKSFLEITGFNNSLDLEVKSSIRRGESDGQV